MQYKRTFLFLMLFGLLVPKTSWSDDLFGIASYPRGAPRYPVNKFGFNNDIDTAEESVWDVDDLPTAGSGPDRCFTNLTSGSTPTAADLYISSDDGNDAGLTVTVEYLDSSWDLASTTVTLGADNGATGTEFVQIGTDTIMRVNRAYAAGADLTGNIYIHKDSVDAAVKDGIPDNPSTDLVAGITAGENQTLMACYSVPNGYNAFFTHWCFSNEGTGTTSITFRLRASINGAAARNKTMHTVADETSQCAPFSPPEMFSEKTDIEITGSTASSQGAGGQFDLVLISENISGLSTK